MLENGDNRSVRCQQRRTHDPIPVLIVSYRNAEDVDRCLRALSRIAPEPAIAVYICENGGATAYESLLSRLTGSGGSCNEDVCPEPPEPRFLQAARLCLPAPSEGRLIPVFVGEGRENYGYAGGVNAWLKPLAAVVDRSWPGVWILNPDTEPTPDALRALVDYASQSGRALTGSRLVAADQGSDGVACGLVWRRWRAATRSIGSGSAETIEAMIDSPSGASMYATREYIDRAGLMNESYFLYFEDLDWGLRAKRHGGVGYAPRSVVVHEFGTTIGSALSRRSHSPLSVFLDFRNRLLFVKRNHPRWIAWTVLMECLEVAEYTRLLAFRNALSALRGAVAGLFGREGRPDDVLAHHHAPRRASPVTQRGFAKRKLKLAISLVFFGLRWLSDELRRLLGAGLPNRLHVLCYHAVKPLQEESFLRQIRCLKAWAKVVPADYQETEFAKPAGALVAITFDDAFQSLLGSVVPALQRSRLPFTIFVPTGYLGANPGWIMETDMDRQERVMTRAQLAELASKGVALGSHTISHPHLTAVSADFARHEIEQSRRDIESIAGRPVSLFAFPYGDYNDACVRMCRECGFTCTFTIDPLHASPAIEAPSRGRVCVSPDDGRLEFYLKAHGGYAWMAKATALKRKLLSLWRLTRNPEFVLSDSRT